MQWLTALLAFATTMLIFAVFVSSFVELIHRVFKLRRQGMELMLENLYTRVIEPHLTAEQAKKVSAGRFVTIIMENRAIARQDDEQQRSGIGAFVHRLIDSSSMTDIPVEVFTQKLADSRIVGEAENFTEEVLQDIAQKYEAFGNEVGTYFGRRARKLSVGVAFVVAWLFYVHPYNLAATYFRNPAIAQSVAAKAADTQSDYRALIERLQSVNRDGSVTGEDATELKAAIDELRQEIDAAQITTRELAQLGVPVGWPGAEAIIVECFDDNVEEISKSSGTAPLNGFCRLPLPLLGTTTLPSMLNVFWLIVGGLLVGLGAPFWAQAVSSLTASRDLTKRITKTVSTANEGGNVSSRARGFAQPASDAPIHVKTFNISRSSQASSALHNVTKGPGAGDENN